MTRRPLSIKPADGKVSLYCNVIIALIHRNKVGISFFRPVEPCGFFPYTEHNGWFYNCENKSLIGSLSLTLGHKGPVHQNIIWGAGDPLAVNLTPIGVSHQRSIDPYIYSQFVICATITIGREKSSHPLSESFTVIFLSFSSLSPLVAQHSDTKSSVDCIYIYVLYIYMKERKRGTKCCVIVFSWIGGKRK